MLTDVNAFLGSWPFLPVPDRSGRDLAAHLRKFGVNRAMVSHLGAVFLPEPMPANYALYATVRGVRSLLPVPILNPALGAWRHHLEECIRLGPVHAVRVMPAFHNYSPRHRGLADLVAELSQRNLPLIVQVRLEDERNRYFGLRVQGSSEKDMATLLAKFADTHVVCCGLYKGEIERLAKRYANFSAEVSFAEQLDTLRSLRKAMPSSRLLFGSNTPILSVPAQTAKVRFADLPQRERRQIGSLNAQRLFTR